MSAFFDALKRIFRAGAETAVDVAKETAAAELGALANPGALIDGLEARALERIGEGFQDPQIRAAMEAVLRDTFTQLRTELAPVLGRLPPLDAV